MWGAAAFDVGSREQLAVRILVINSGSSSVKFELFDMESESSLLRGEVERIGEAGSSAWSEAEGGDREEREVQARDHHEALGVVLGMLSPSGLTEGIGAVGHRVVHGGDRFARPVEIDDGVVSAISAFALLAPLHTKANVAGIDAARSCGCALRVTRIERSTLGPLQASGRFRLPTGRPGGLLPPAGR